MLQCVFSYYLPPLQKKNRHYKNTLRVILFAPIIYLPNIIFNSSLAKKEGANSSRACSNNCCSISYRAEKCPNNNCFTPALRAIIAACPQSDGSRLTCRRMGGLFGQCNRLMSECRLMIKQIDAFDPRYQLLAISRIGTIGIT